MVGKLLLAVLLCAAYPPNVGRESHPFQPFLWSQCWERNVAPSPSPTKQRSMERTFLSCSLYAHLISQYRNIDYGWLWCCRELERQPRVIYRWFLTPSRLRTRSKSNDMNVLHLWFSIAPVMCFSFQYVCLMLHYLMTCLFRLQEKALIYFLSKR